MTTATAIGTGAGQGAPAVPALLRLPDERPGSSRDRAGLVLAGSAR